MNIRQHRQRTEYTRGGRHQIAARFYRQQLCTFFAPIALLCLLVAPFVYPASLRLIDEQPIRQLALAGNGAGAISNLRVLEQLASNFRVSCAWLFSTTTLLLLLTLVALYFLFITAQFVLFRIAQRFERWFIKRKSVLRILDTLSRQHDPSLIKQQYAIAGALIILFLSVVMMTSEKHHYSSLILARGLPALIIVVAFVYLCFELWQGRTASLLLELKRSRAPWRERRKLPLIRLFEVLIFTLCFVFSLLCTEYLMGTRFDAVVSLVDGRASWLAESYAQQITEATSMDSTESHQTLESMLQPYKRAVAFCSTQVEQARKVFRVFLNTLPVALALTLLFQVAIPLYRLGLGKRTRDLLFGVAATVVATFLVEAGLPQAFLIENPGPLLKVAFIITIFVFVGLFELSWLHFSKHKGKH